MIVHFLFILLMAGIQRLFLGGGGFMAKTEGQLALKKVTVRTCRCAAAIEKKIQ